MPMGRGRFHMTKEVRRNWRIVGDGQQREEAVFIRVERQPFATRHAGEDGADPEDESSLFDREGAGGAGGPSGVWLRRAEGSICIR